MSPSRTDDTSDRSNSSNISTTSSSNSNFTPYTVRADNSSYDTVRTDDCGYYHTSHGYDYEYKKKCDIQEEKMLKIMIKRELMEGWFSRKPVIKPIIKRPSIQLRGVCFCGRGWA